MRKEIFEMYFDKEAKIKRDRKLPRRLYVVSGPSVSKRRKEAIVRGIESLTDELNWNLMVKDVKEGKHLDEFLRQHRDHNRINTLASAYASKASCEPAGYLFIANEIREPHKERKTFHRGNIHSSVFFIGELNPDFDSLAPKLYIARKAGLEAIHEIEKTEYGKKMGKLAPGGDCLNYYSPKGSTLCETCHYAFAGALAGRMVSDKKNYFAIRRRS